MLILIGHTFPCVPTFLYLFLKMSYYHCFFTLKLLFTLKKYRSFSSVASLTQILKDINYIISIILTNAASVEILVFLSLF